MKYVERAIQKAKEAGYWPDYTRVYFRFTKPETGGIECEETGIFLDPLFWQSLGKSLGWTDDSIKHVYVWKYQWHMFIDHLAESKSAESFFESLINVKE